MSETSQELGGAAITDQGFQAVRQVTDYYQTSSGQEYEYVHEPTQLIAEDQPLVGFTPEIAATLSAAEAEKIENTWSSLKTRLVVYPINVVGSVAIGLFGQSVDSEPKDNIQAYIAQGVISFLILTGMVEWLSIGMDRKRVKEARARIADIQQNTVTE